MFRERIVIVGGWGFSRRIIEKELAPFAKQFEPIVIGLEELVGGRPPALKLQTILSQMEVSAALGWSTGGAVLLEVLAQGESQINKAVVVAGFPKFVKQRELEEEYSLGVELAELRMLERNLKRDRPAALNDFIAQAFAPNHPEPEQLAALVADSESLTPGVLEKGLTYLQEIDLRESLPALELPLLFIHGEMDGIVLADNSRYLAERCKGAELEIYPNVGHTVIFDCAAAIAERISGFLHHERG